MGSSLGTSFLDHFAALRDLRQSCKVVHPLLEVLLTVLCGTLAGAEDFVKIRRWALLHLDFLRRFLPFASGIPSHDTLNEIMNAIDAELFARAVREHWQIENRLHWVLDVVFHEDLNRLRFGDGPQNIATVRHIALNLLRSAKGKHSLKVRRKSAAWDETYREALIRQTA